MKLPSGVSGSECGLHQFGSNNQLKQDCDENKYLIKKQTLTTVLSKVS